MGDYVWVLLVSGRDYRRIQTCVTIRLGWLAAYRRRIVDDGGTVLAVYRPR